MEYHMIVCLKWSSRRKGFLEFTKETLVHYNEILPRFAPFLVECSTLAVTGDVLSALSFYKERWYMSSLVIIVRTLVPWTQTHFPRLFCIIQSAACFITRLLHYLLFDVVACNGRNIGGAYVAKIAVPNREIGTTFASVWNKGFPFKEIISFRENRGFGSREARESMCDLSYIWAQQSKVQQNPLRKCELLQAKG